MAFLVNRIVFEETLIDNHDINLGDSSFSSSTLFDMSIISIQVTLTSNSLDNDVEVYLEQSNDGINFDEIPNSSSVIPNNGSVTIERNNFSGKYIKIIVKHAPDGHIGNMNAYLIAKR